MGKKRKIPLVSITSSGEVCVGEGDSESGKRLPKTVKL